MRLWDVPRQQPSGALPASTDKVLAVAFSADGSLLAHGGRDNVVHLWDMASQKLVGQPLTGHADNIMSLAFSPRDKILASGSGDSTVRLWDVTNPRAVTSIGEPLTSSLHAESAWRRRVPSGADSGLLCPRWWWLSMHSGTACAGPDGWVQRRPSQLWRLGR